ncbi:phosphoglycerate dehydrogenase-like enzyme [Streptacidiphilus sp. MAP5-52]
MIEKQTKAILTIGIPFNTVAHMSGMETGPRQPPAGSRPRAALAMDPALLPQLLDAAAWRRLRQTVDLVSASAFDDFTEPAALRALAEAEVLLTCWGCPPLTESVLAAAPRLRSIIHAAGSVKSHVTATCWERGLSVSSAAAANAAPVAEFTVAMVLLANKQIWQAREEYRAVRGRHDWRTRFSTAGNFRRVIGVVGASHIGRHVIELLRPHDLRILVHDPYLTAEEAARLGVEAAELDTLCARSDVVTLHAQSCRRPGGRSRAGTWRPCGTAPL